MKRGRTGEFVAVATAQDLQQDADTQLLSGVGGQVRPSDETQVRPSDETLVAAFPGAREAVGYRLYVEVIEAKITTQHCPVGDQVTIAGYRRQRASQRHICSDRNSGKFIYTSREHSVKQ